MSKNRLSRKEIKQDIREDEVQTFLQSVFFWLEENAKTALAIGAAVLVLIAAGFGLRSFAKSRTYKANDQLATALKIGEAPIQEEGAEPDNPTEPSFANEEDRKARRKEALEDVSGGGPKEVAGLLLADIAAEEGDSESARSTWEKISKQHEDNVLGIATRLNLIQLDRQEGRAEELAERLQEELNSSRKTLPEDTLIFELAQTLELLDRGDEAVDLYQRILDDYPQSAYANDARQRVPAS